MQHSMHTCRPLSMRHVKIKIMNYTCVIRISPFSKSHVVCCILHYIYIYINHSVWRVATSILLGLPVQCIASCTLFSKWSLEGIHVDTKLTNNYISNLHIRSVTTCNSWNIYDIFHTMQGMMLATRHTPIPRHICSFDSNTPTTNLHYICNSIGIVECPIRIPLRLYYRLILTLVDDGNWIKPLISNCDRCCSQCTPDPSL